MSRKSSTDSSNLQSWFRAERYGSLSNLGEVDWYLQFVCRRMLRQLAQIETELHKRPLSEEDFSFKLFKQIAVKPIVTYNDIIDLDLPNGFLNLMFYGEAFRPNSSSSMGVQPATLNDVYERQALLDETVRSRASRYSTEITSEIPDKQFLKDPGRASGFLLERRKKHFLKSFLSEYYSDYVGEENPNNCPYEAHFDEPLYVSQQAVPINLLFSVNPFLPDELLVKQFKASLVASRHFFEGTGYSFQDRDKSFESQKKRWIEYLILQFIDIQTGTQICGEQMMNETIWKCLVEVGNTEKDNSNLRKTNEALAKEMMASFSLNFFILEVRAAALLRPEKDERFSAHDQKLGFDDEHFRQYRKK